MLKANNQEQLYLLKLKTGLQMQIQAFSALIIHCEVIHQPLCSYSQKKNTPFFYFI